MQSKDALNQETIQISNISRIAEFQANSGVRYFYRV